MTKNSWILAFRLSWLCIPFAGYSVFDSALSSRSNPVQITSFIGLWLLWSIVLAVCLVPSSSLLTLFRVLVPISVVLAIWGSIESQLGISSIFLLVISSIAASISLLPTVGFWFINGSSYGDEVRVPLRPPGPLLLGPIPLAWILVAATIIFPPLIIASGNIFLGLLFITIGLACCAVAYRSLSALTKRWLVFVPAGLVLHDSMVVADPFLLRKTSIKEFKIAVSNSQGKDLTLSSLGLAIEVILFESADLSLQINPLAPPELASIDSFLIAPSIVSIAVDEAKRRSIPVT
ncbi:MAG: hypothetical protein CL454_08970 [Acidimicrobiaceae bacterium]|nr:hypothetical protein [Acidimicrobiaceae bacterium]